MSSVACLTLPYDSTLSHERYDFRGKKFSVFLFFSTNLSVTFLILRKTQRDIITKCKVPLILGIF